MEQGRRLTFVVSRCVCLCGRSFEIFTAETLGTRPQQQRSRTFGELQLQLKHHRTLFHMCTTGGPGGVAFSVLHFNREGLAQPTLSLHKMTLLNSMQKACSAVNPVLAH